MEAKTPPRRCIEARCSSSVGVWIVATDCTMEEG